MYFNLYSIDLKENKENLKIKGRLSKCFPEYGTFIISGLIYHNCITNAFETTTIRDKSMSLTRNTLRGMYTAYALSYDFFNYYKKHLDASVKERSQTLLVPSEEICKRVLCNKHI